ncbi:hypothetical protein HS088_TW23G00781 [Tripterygium wilfordii]|uniref:Regulator of Vps4 activity in the MVB pathway protein n=1 Tax=Tripterygium wilfordii TaxID=458696 RepID=A0A7J7BVY5_TRIWF|nr:nucleolar protein NET1-like [Tripterygium wilfordii]KAF5726043.1 hypothetical protein HS088_TW23G00781 [Tripterygium wilfordii]
MLHRSFKPAKCKTALKLAASRIKLMRNKREVQVKQMKRDLVKLLVSGQDRTARIRVEHVLREEKTMAAYDLLEIYCELLVARLPIIESQKTCPIDLKEAISSVIFASPRCADIPELLDVRKHFKAKYGKEFASAAVELRPDCGVSRLLVEKLSAKAPDGPTKMKILREIAEEHNIKWDPESFEEKDTKPPEDLLNGPSSFEAASRMHAEPPNVPVTPHHVGRGPVNFQEAPKQVESPNVHMNLNEHNARPSSLPQSFASTMASDPPHPELKPLGGGSEGMKHTHSFTGDGHSYTGQNWNMDFKDATAAAQAAAESAERASMAARAAVELSSREMTTRQQSMKSQKSSTYGPRDEGLWNIAGSKLPGESAKDQIKYTFQERSSGNLTERIDRNDLDDARLTERFNQINSTMAASNYVDSVAPMPDNFQVADKYPRNDSLDSVTRGFSGEANLKERSNLSGREFVNEEDEMKSEEESVRKQSSRVSSHSHSSSLGDDHLVVPNLFQQNVVNNFDDDPFISYEGMNEITAKETTSYGNDVLAFDDSGSEYGDGDEHHQQEISGYPQDQESSSHMLAMKQEKLGLESYLPQQHSTTVFSEGLENSTIHPSQDDLFPATFDDSDGPSSESEEEKEKFKLVGSLGTGYKQNVFSSNPELPTGSSSVEKEDVGSNKKSWLSASTYDELNLEKNHGIEVNDGSNREYEYAYMPSTQPSTIPMSSQSKSSGLNAESFNNHQHSRRSSGLALVQEVKNDVQTPESIGTMMDAEVSKDFSLEGDKELNFGTLTGGLRNKGYRQPPYTRNPGNASLSRQDVEDTCTRNRIEQSSLSPKVETSISLGFRDQESDSKMVRSKVNEKTSTRAPITYFDSSDDSDVELPQQTFGKTQKPYKQKADNEANRRPSSKTYFDSDNSDSEQGFAKQTSSSKIPFGTGFSRRTKVTSALDRNYLPKASVPSESTETVDDGLQKKSSAKTSYGTESRQEWQSQSQSQERPDNVIGSEEPKGVHKQAASKQITISKSSSNEDNWKISALEQPSSSLPKIAASAKSESSKILNKETPSRENSINKAGHVHPKLPDYEALTANMQSLRQNRQ